MKKALIFLSVLLLLGCTSVQETSENTTTDNGLNALINIAGVDPENFNFDLCIYLHGDDGKIRNWQDFDDMKKDRLSKLFSEAPTIKIDYSKNPNDVSDEIWVGPICDCDEYNRTPAQSGLCIRYWCSFSPKKRASKK